MDWHWPITLQNSTFIEIGVNPNEEVIDDRFAINGRRGIYVEPGRYEFKEYFVLANTNARGAVLDEPALRQRRVLRRLPPQLHRSAARSG